MSGESAFIQTIQECSGGNLQHDLNNALIELVGIVRATNRKGSLTLTLTVAPAKGSEIAVSLEPNLSVKQPKIERELTMFYADAQNRLSRNDPRQPLLPGVPAGRPKSVVTRDFRAAASSDVAIDVPATAVGDNRP